MKESEKLDHYPFIKAGLEDAALVSEIVSGRIGTPRHVVCLMHDAIEFTLYEILLLENQDIYISGQHTIGLDRALEACRKLGIDIPLIGTIRAIQKHRGDAKHHAQVPHEGAYRKMIAEFRIVISRLIHEQFGRTLGETVKELGLLSYHSALYDSYRKYRNHNWNLALRYIIGALLHKHRSILKMPDNYISGGINNVLEVLRYFEEEVALAEYPPAPREIIEFVRGLPSSLRELIQEEKFSEAAEIAGQAYSKLDKIMPTLFEIKDALIITAQLVKPKYFKYSKAMAWTKFQRGDTKKKEEYNSKLRSLLKENPNLVSKFGPPQYAEDDDRYWKWWEFAVFDGERWHSFHLDDSYNLSLEIGSVDDKEAARREKVAKLIYDQFEMAIQTSSKEKTKTP
jgi:hypothetical protein